MCNLWAVPFLTFYAEVTYFWQDVILDVQIKIRSFLREMPLLEISHDVQV